MTDKEHQLTGMDSAGELRRAGYEPETVAGDIDLEAIRGRQEKTPEYMKGRADKEIADLLRVVDEAVGLMQEFCDRSDRGEIRSTRTYSKFSAFLTKLGASSASRNPSGVVGPDKLPTGASHD